MIYINYSINDMEHNIKQNYVPEKTYKLKKIKQLNINDILDTDINELRLRLYELTYIITYGIKLLSLNNFILSDKLVQQFKDKINNTCGINLSDNEYITFLTLLVKQKDNISKLLMTEDDYINTITTKNIIKMIDFNDQHGGFSINDTMSYITEPDSNKFTKILDIVGLILDVIGFVPGIGMITDASSFIISVLRLQWFDSICSLINMIPILGSFIGTPMKYLRKYDRIKKIQGLKSVVNKETK